MQGVIEVNPSRLATLYTDGRELPYLEFGQVEPAIKLVYGGEEYWYYKTLPLKGYGAVLARYVQELESDGQMLLLARFWDRIYIFATGIRPIGAGKAPGA